MRVNRLSGVRVLFSLVVFALLAFSSTARADDGFTLTASPVTQFIVGPGATKYQISLTSIGAFAGQIDLACSGIPADATCTFTNNPVLTSGSTATTTLTVTTTLADAQLRKPSISRSNFTDLAPIVASVLFPIELTCFFGFLRRKSRNTRKLSLLTGLLLTLGLLGLSGCGAAPVFHTYTINITGTSLTFTAPSQSTAVLLSVGNQYP